VVVNNKQLNRARDYHAAFVINHVGKNVLDDLEEAFNGSCYDDNPYRMAYKEGQRDALLYIKERINEYAG
jgi:hypothetical protein